MLHRDPEREVFPLCQANGISQIVWSPLAQGALTGKYKPGAPPPEGTRATSGAMGAFMDNWLQDDVLERVQRLVSVAERLGITMAQLALAWVLREANVASAIVGASRPEQVHDNASASGIELDARRPLGREIERRSWSGSGASRAHVACRAAKLRLAEDEFDRSRMPRRKLRSQGES